MNQDILLSKIVPNSTDTTWAQAYTTLNVYITLSIQNDNSKSPVTNFGKELLEKLQREFFALDEKTLDNIKNAVGNVSESIPEDYKYSILVGSIVENILYIVIASKGQVLIKRDEKIGVIATGTENELHGFSGRLEHDDILVFETGDFASKLPITTISLQLSSTDVSQIAENITPLVHDGSKGTESAIILQYKNFTGQEKESKDFELQDQTEEEKVEEDNSEKIEKIEEENLWTKSQENRQIEEIAEEEQPSEDKQPSRPFIALPSMKFGNKRLIIGVVIVLLIAIFAGSILLQMNNKNEEKREGEFNTIYQPLKSRFDEGVNLASLNKTLALAEFTEVSKSVDDAIQKFPQNSEENKKLAELKSQIQTKISELGGGGSAKNVKEFVKANGDIKSINSISTRGGKIVILDSEGKQVATVSTGGKIQKTYEIDDNAISLTSDDKFIYTIGDSITQIDTGNGNVKVIVKEAKGKSVQSFGSNVYTVTNDDVIKYRAPSYSESSYFTDQVSFKSTPVDLGISGPVWVLEESGNIERFTKGKNDNIELKGLGGPIGSEAKIYADSELDNVYIMDVKNQRVVVFNSDGEYQTQYEGDFIKNAKSFAIDEENKTGYVVSNDTVYSFDL